MSVTTSKKYWRFCDICPNALNTHLYNRVIVATAPASEVGVQFLMSILYEPLYPQCFRLAVCSFFARDLQTEIVAKYLMCLIKDNRMETAKWAQSIIVTRDMLLIWIVCLSSFHCVHKAIHKVQFNLNWYRQIVKIPDLTVWRVWRCRRLKVIVVGLGIVVQKKTNPLSKRRTKLWISLVFLEDGLATKWLKYCHGVKP